METTDQKFGFYSMKAVDAGCGTSFWSTPDGREVEVTMVGEAGSCRWPDAQELGPVVQWTRRGRSKVWS